MRTGSIPQLYYSIHFRSLVIVGIWRVKMNAYIILFNLYNIIQPAHQRDSELITSHITRNLQILQPLM